MSDFCKSVPYLLNSTDAADQVDDSGREFIVEID